MAITQKQEAYAKNVASGMDFHTAALEAGCKIMNLPESSWRTWQSVRMCKPVSLT
ncbi:hypothetical protein [Moraxella catarrhalis]|uniref:hypothetical protein n=1 Tax=Moraxella catarrhalis TaxID=480 RepID=UPI00071F55D5|nr:hypothetical protein [Moraxella catarrhalis]AKI27151.1 hypothetical protein [Moraxella phage Mcat4]